MSYDKLPLRILSTEHASHLGLKIKVSTDVN